MRFLRAGLFGKILASGRSVGLLITSPTINGSPCKRQDEHHRFFEKRIKDGTASYQEQHLIVRLIFSLAWPFAPGSRGPKEERSHCPTPRPNRILTSARQLTAGCEMGNWLQSVCHGISFPLISINCPCLRRQSLCSPPILQTASPKATPLRSVSHLPGFISSFSTRSGQRQSAGGVAQTLV